MLSRPLHRLSRLLPALLLAAACCTALPAHAQALRPLPPEFLGILKEADVAIVNMSGTLKRIKAADLSFSLFSGAKVEDSMTRMDQTLTQVQAQINDLRSKESLMALLVFKNTLAGFQRDLSAAYTSLNGAKVRTPSDAEKLNSLLTEIEKNNAALNGAIGRLDGAALALMENLDRQAGQRK